MSKRHPLIPAIAPHLIQDYYTPEEVDALFGVVKNHGPWPLISALHFTSTEEFLAVAGGKNVPADAKLTDFTSPSFRGYLGQLGVCYYDEVHDIYFSDKLMKTVKEVHGAQYAMTHGMLFNIAGPSHSYDSGHVDSASYRGLTTANCPVWVSAVMAKSGLFEEYKVKTAQVITYFYESGIDGGFTYWPDGPDRKPQRFVPPFHNSAIVSDNSQMYHRREANGPRELRDCPELEITTKLHWGGDDQWILRNGDTEIGRFDEANRRALFHWTGLVFMDSAEVKEYLEHTNDLTLDKVFNMLMADLTERGVAYTEPDDPATDQAFIDLLTKTYALSPDEYPAEAPVNAKAPSTYV
ncbi:MAG: hypothetical protein GXX86_07840 [Propionibacterium sp.]|nr:hypothetical protein [Propionibacterium sp.]